MFDLKFVFFHFNVEKVSQKFSGLFSFAVRTFSSQSSRKSFYILFSISNIEASLEFFGAALFLCTQGIFFLVSVYRKVCGVTHLMRVTWLIHTFFSIPNFKAPLEFSGYFFLFFCLQHSDSSHACDMTCAFIFFYSEFLGTGFRV